MPVNIHTESGRRMQEALREVQGLLDAWNEGEDGPRPKQADLCIQYGVSPRAFCWWKNGLKAFWTPYVVQWVDARVASGDVTLVVFCDEHDLPVDDFVWWITQVASDWQWLVQAADVHEGDEWEFCQAHRITREALRAMRRRLAVLPDLSASHRAPARSYRRGHLADETQWARCRDALFNNTRGFKSSEYRKHGRYNVAAAAREASVNRVIIRKAIGLVRVEARPNQWGNFHCALFMGLDRRRLTVTRAYTLLERYRALPVKCSARRTFYESILAECDFSHYQFRDWRRNRLRLPPREDAFHRGIRWYSRWLRRVHE